MPKRNLAIAPKAFSKLDAEVVAVATEEEKRHHMQEQVAKYATERTVVYCSSCEKGVRCGGGNPVHMIELLTADL